MIPLGTKERTEVSENVRKAVAKKIFAPGFDPKEWARLCEVHRGRILAADTVEEFEAEVRALLAELKISHITFFHRSLLKIPPPYAIGATFQREQVNGSAHWMFQDVHEGSPPQIAGVQPGDLLLEIEGSPVAPPEQPAFRMDGFCDVGVEKLTGERTTVKLGVPLPTSKWHPIVRPRLVSWSKPQPGIGLLKVTGFPGQVGIDVAKEIDHAVSELRDCDRLIIDLRGNPGGGAGGLRLMNYMTPGKIPVGYSITQKRAAKGFEKEKLPRFGKIPSRKIALYPLLLRYAFSDRSIVMVTEGLGPQPFHGRMGHGFVLRIPVVTFHTWNGSTLEGRGVEPDCVVELSRRALKDDREASARRQLKSPAQHKTPCSPEALNVTTGRRSRIILSTKATLSAHNVKPFRFMPDQHRFVSEIDFENYRSNRKPVRPDVLLTAVGVGIGDTPVQPFTTNEPLVCQRRQAGDNNSS